MIVLGVLEDEDPDCQAAGPRVRLGLLRQPQLRIYIYIYI